MQANYIVVEIKQHAFDESSIQAPDAEQQNEAQIAKNHIFPV